MELEERVAALEARIEEQETKRLALRNQFIALQLVVIKLLPIISASSADQLGAAIDQAKSAAMDGLLLAGFDAPDRADVLEAMDALRDDLAGTGQRISTAFWH